MFFLVLILESGHKLLEFPAPSFCKLITVNQFCLQEKQGIRAKGHDRVKVTECWKLAALASLSSPYLAPHNVRRWYRVSRE